LLIALLGLWPLEALSAGDEPARELTKEERDQLEGRLRELFQQGHAHLQHARYADALKCWEQNLAVATQLYPRTQYPHGHFDLCCSLNNMAVLLRELADYVGARDYYQQALAMHRELFPLDKYPDGYPDLARTLDGLGLVLLDQGDYAGGRVYLNEALRMRQAFYPQAKFPDGHAELAGSLNNIGGSFKMQGEYVVARGYFQRALAMQQALYPTDRFPEGHPDLAKSLGNLGGVVYAQGDYAGARALLEQSLTMYQALYPKQKYPRGHPDLAASLHSFAVVLHDQGNYGDARDYYQQALAMYQTLCPKDQLPRGHPAIATSLYSLGILVQDQGDYKGARAYLDQALASRQALYPEDQYPQGHEALAQVLNGLGGLLRHQGSYTDSRRYYQQALVMYQALFPKDRYPQGQIGLASTLYNLGAVLMVQGDYAGALPYSQQALDMYQGFAENVMAAASEAEALNRIASLPTARDVLLSLTRHLPGSDAICYAQVWRCQGAVFRILRSRQQALRQVADSESRELWNQWVQTRRDLGRLILSPPRVPELHLKRLRELTDLKEKLERQLADRSAIFRSEKASEYFTADDLAQKLAGWNVFIDLLHYRAFEQDQKLPGKKGEKWTPSYVAFVLRPGQAPVRVELGAAEPIEAAVAAWRRELAKQPASSAAQTVRHLVWDRLAPHLPAGTRTVFVAPDGALTQLPWAALPGIRPGSVLLEDYAFAVVPNGPFLLECLTAAPKTESSPGLLLAVGDVQYDRLPHALPQPKPEQTVAWRAVERGRRTARWSAERAAAAANAAAAGPFQALPFFLIPTRPSWNNLPGTRREIEAVRQLALPRPVQIRRGSEATTATLLRDLPQARYALLSTHGFFADPQFRSVFLLDEAAFRHQGREGRATPGARNPLVLSGLVLAGANEAPSRDSDGVSSSDGSILTAEMIASLPLEHLELAVLSACETGLGEVAGGEGVYGLQRAFHMAGARTAVASLWKVDDNITQELLTRFFDNLWHKGMGRLEALRQAQLAVRQGEGNRAQARYWAAWVLSGDPGDLDPSGSAIPAALPAAPAVAPGWSGWPVYALGGGLFLVVVLTLILTQRRRLKTSQR
jgi:CHAT domain-containing protein/Tfp pilus assembly protein PilF